MPFQINHSVLSLAKNIRHLSSTLRDLQTSLSEETEPELQAMFQDEIESVLDSKQEMEACSRRV